MIFVALISILTTLPEGRHSYHFSAFDGVSWNSTSNTVLKTFDKEEEIDVTPLVLGVFAGLIVVTVVYIFRKR